MFYECDLVWFYLFWFNFFVCCCSLFVDFVYVGWFRVLMFEYLLSFVIVLGSWFVFDCVYLYLIYCWLLMFVGLVNWLWYFVCLCFDWDWCLEFAVWVVIYLFGVVWILCCGLVVILDYVDFLLLSWLCFTLVLCVMILFGCICLVIWIRVWF